METASATLGISLMVKEGRERAAERAAQAKAAEEQRTAAARAHLDELWQPYRATALAALPDWAQPYLQEADVEPTTWRDGNTHYRPMTLALPDVAPIHVYVDGGLVRYYTPRAILEHDDYGNAGWLGRYSWGEWSVTRRSIQQMTGDLAVAVYQAQAAGEQYRRCQAEAEQRNREDVPQPEPQPEPVSPLQSARRWLSDWQSVDASAAFGDSLDRVLMAAQVAAAIAQADALVRLAEVAESWLEQEVG